MQKEYKSKNVSVFLSFVLAFAMLLLSSFSAFAIGPNEDGVYEVPIEMWHAEKDRTSMGDSYIIHTALLTVSGDEKTLTVVPAKTTSDMQFWYYEDGSVEGNTIEVERKSNVEIGGTVYGTAFEFPIESDNEFVGVKFAASAMPVSPSARIKIDYDSAKKVNGTGIETPAPIQETTAKVTTVRETTTKTTTIQETTTATATAQETTYFAEPVSEAKEEKTKSKKTPIAIVCGAVGAVALAVVIAVVIKKNKTID